MLWDLRGDSIRMLWDCKSDTNGFCKSSITFLKGFPDGLYKDFYKDPKGIQGDSTGLLQGFYNGFPKGVL